MPPHYLAKRFQRKRLKCKNLTDKMTDDGGPRDDKSSHGFGQVNINIPVDI